MKILLLCHRCVFHLRDENSIPCCVCRAIGKGSINHFTAKKEIEQPTIPPMPPVKPPKEETNRPLRIDVMVDVFGIEATKHFCLLNAFKCLWGAETEKSKEDVENAAWYLNEYIRLGGEDK